MGKYSHYTYLEEGAWDEYITFGDEPTYYIGGKVVTKPETETETTGE